MDDQKLVYEQGELKLCYSCHQYDRCDIECPYWPYRFTLYEDEVPECMDDEVIGIE